jgi:hypothetical protein
MLSFEGKYFAGSDWSHGTRDCVSRACQSTNDLRVVHAAFSGIVRVAVLRGRPRQGEHENCYCCSGAELADHRAGCHSKRSTDSAAGALDRAGERHLNGYLRAVFYLGDVLSHVVVEALQGEDCDDQRDRISARVPARIVQCIVTGHGLQIEGVFEESLCDR